jgi:translation initiation factor 6
MVLVNDKAALVGSQADPALIDLVSTHLRVEVRKGSIANLEMTGVCAVVNGKGLVAHPMTTDPELKELGELFNIRVDISTVNCGFPYLRVGMAANSNGAVVGNATTGPEMVRIESSLGITGD